MIRQTINVSNVIIKPNRDSRRFECERVKGGMDVTI